MDLDITKKNNIELFKSHIQHNIHGINYPFQYTTPPSMNALI